MIPNFRVAFKNNILSEVGSIDFVDETVTTPVYDKLDGEYLGDNVWGLNQVTLMQSTGLFDNSTPKKEIFEGDVVELHHFTENYSETGGFYEGEESLVGVVRYGYTDDEIKYFGKVYPPRWFIENRYRELVFSDLSGLHEESFKVIGNVYQNKELTEGLK